MRYFLVLALALAACRSAVEPSAILAGHWRGTVNAQVLDITLAEANGVVGGSGTIRQCGTTGRLLCLATATTAPVLASGTFAAPDATVTLTFRTGEALTLAGRVQGETFAGVATSGARSATFALQRVP